MVNYGLSVGKGGEFAGGLRVGLKFGVGITKAQMERVTHVVCNVFAGERGNLTSYGS